jgi:hypothetical protein
MEMTFWQLWHNIILSNNFDNNFTKLHQTHVVAVFLIFIYALRKITFRIGTGLASFVHAPAIFPVKKLVATEALPPFVPRMLLAPPFAY